jgi:hypothetical protein
LNKTGIDPSWPETGALLRAERMRLRAREKR